MSDVLGLTRVLSEYIEKDKIRQAKKKSYKLRKNTIQPETVTN